MVGHFVRTAKRRIFPVQLNEAAAQDEAASCAGFQCHVMRCRNSMTSRWGNSSHKTWATSASHAVQCVSGDIDRPSLKSHGRGHEDVHLPFNESGFFGTNRQIVVEIVFLKTYQLAGDRTRKSIFPSPTRLSSLTQFHSGVASHWTKRLVLFT
jgi:hypothetical protein